MTRFMKLCSVFLVVLAGSIAVPAWAELWTLVPAEPTPRTAANPLEDVIAISEDDMTGPARLGHHQPAKLDSVALQGILDRAPSEADLVLNGVELQLPTPQGTFERFFVPNPERPYRLRRPG